jgi:hypothetical protein
VDVQRELWRRLESEWLPAYCNDPTRCYAIEAFKADAKKVADVDARDFLRALDRNVVSLESGGRFLQSTETPFAFSEPSQSAFGLAHQKQAAVRE